MIIEQQDGCFYEANHVDFSDFESLVSAANIAGYLEAKEKISLDSDMRLTEFILAEYKHWLDEEWKNYDFNKYITNRLLKEFGFDED